MLETGGRELDRADVMLHAAPCSMVLNGAMTTNQCCVGTTKGRDPAVIRPPLCTHSEEHVNSAICFLVKRCTVLTSFL